MTVSPDVSVFGRSGAGLIIQGNLTAKSGIGSPILFTSSSAPTGIWPGIVFAGVATGNLEGVTLQYGGGSFTGGSSYPAGGLVFYNLSSDAVIVRHSEIANASSTGWVFNNSNNTLSDTLDANIISAINGVGIQLNGTSQVLMANTVVIDNRVVVLTSIKWNPIDANCTQRLPAIPSMDYVQQGEQAQRSQMQFSLAMLWQSGLNPVQLLMFKQHYGMVTPLILQVPERSTVSIGSTVRLLLTLLTVTILHNIPKLLGKRSQRS